MPGRTRDHDRVSNAIRKTAMADFFIHVDMGANPSRFTMAFYGELVGRGFVSTGEDFLARVSFDQNAVAWYKSFRDAGHSGVLSMLHAEDASIWDPTIRKPSRDEDMLSNAKYSTYAGWILTGWPLTTIRRGEVVYDGGRVLAKPGSGRFIPGAPFKVPTLRPRANQMAVACTLSTPPALSCVTHLERAVHFTIIQFKRVLPDALRVNTYAVSTADSAIRPDARGSSG